VDHGDNFSGSISSSTVGGRGNSNKIYNSNHEQQSPGTVIRGPSLTLCCWLIYWLLVAEQKISAREIELNIRLAKAREKLAAKKEKERLKKLEEEVKLLEALATEDDE